MIDINDRVRVEEGFARKRALATAEHLLSTGYARYLERGETAPPKGWRHAPEIGEGVICRRFCADGHPIAIGESYQYLTTRSGEKVWYVYVLQAVRHPRTDKVSPRYVPESAWPTEREARARAGAVSADLAPIVDTNDDGVIDFRDMPVVEA